MMKKSKSFYLAIISLIIVFFILLLIPKKSQPLEKGNDNYIVNPRSYREDSEILKIAVNYSENILNPFYDSKRDISLVSNLINASLVKKDKNNSIILDLAKEYWYEDEGRTIAIVLKPDLRFASGDSLTTEDVKNTYKVLLDPSYSGSHSDYIENIRGYYDYKKNRNEKNLGIEVINDTFMKIHFDMADLNNVNILTFPIVNLNNKIHDYKDIEKMKFIDGSGPYKLEKDSGDSVSLVLRDGEDSSIKKIEIYNYMYFRAMSEFKKGNIDIVYKYDDILKIEGIKTERMDEYSYFIDNQANNYYLLGIGPKSKYFNKSEFRRALRNSIDFEKVVGDAFGRGNYLYPIFPLYENSWFMGKDFNIDSGESLKDLFSKNFEIDEDGFLDGDKPLVIKLLAGENDDFAKAISEGLKEQFKKQGLSLDISFISDYEMFEYLNGGGDYDLIISNRFNTELPSLKNEFILGEEDQYLNTDLISKKIFSLVINREKEDPQIYKKKMGDLIKTWQDSFLESMPYIVIASPKVTTIINKEISGIYLNEFVGLDNIENLRNIKISDN